MNKNIATILLFFFAFHVSAQEGLYNSDVFYVSEDETVFVTGDFSNAHIDFENNGDFTLIGGLENTAEIQTVGVGTFRLTGFDQQTIDLFQDFKTSNLEIENNRGADFIGQADLEVHGDLDFIDGIFYTNRSSLINFKPSSVYFYASDTSHINGPAIKEGNTQFTFPIGKENRLRPLRIAETASTNSFIAEYFRDTYFNLSTDQSLNNVSDYEYWNFDKIFGSDGAQLTLVWDENSFIDPFEEDLRIAYYNQPNWIAINSTTTLPEQLDTDLTSVSPIFTYGDFTFGSVNERTLLRDGLRNFSVNKEECFIRLDWQSRERSTHVDRYEIHRSQNAQDFEVVETLTAFNQSDLQRYSFLDETVENNEFYQYKLVTFYSDGERSETDLRVVRTTCQEFDLYVYPNPIIPGNNLTIHVLSDVDVNVPILIVDELGRVLIEQDLAVQPGMNQYTIDVQRFGMAEYYIWTPEFEHVETLEFQIIR